MGNGQWAMGNGQWAMGNGVMGNGQCPSSPQDRVLTATVRHWRLTAKPRLTKVFTF
ncbi:MAG: hypothetical protein KME30_32655 [Iphinoe sp. HA4291-MV1]|nr:hypothetical protein [Iphinoe sp. HA4291-MV1]